MYWLPEQLAKATVYQREKIFWSAVRTLQCSEKFVLLCSMQPASRLILNNVYHRQRNALVSIRRAGRNLFQKFYEQKQTQVVTSK